MRQICKWGKFKSGFFFPFLFLFPFLHPLTALSRARAVGQHRRFICQDPFVFRDANETDSKPGGSLTYRSIFCQRIETDWRKKRIFHLQLYLLGRSGWIRGWLYLFFYIFYFHLSWNRRIGAITPIWSICIPIFISIFKHVFR